MSATALGYIRWSANRTESQRDYKITWLVKTDDYEDGPNRVLNAAGLANVGTSWIYGNDNDPWAFCTPVASAKPVYDTEVCAYWEVDQLFSTRPLTRCQDNDIEDPLSEPPRISGSFIRYVKEAERDRHGMAILSSGYEQIRGIEKDAGRPTVVIEMNTLNLGAELAAQMQDTLNDSPLWGMDERKIKLTWPSWERRLYGTCSYYYTRRFEFEIRFEGFDRDDILDAGYRVFRGAPFSATDPANYIVYKDPNGENSPQKVLLDGNGSPLTDPTTPIYIPTVEIYDESNFYALGIPSSL